jgi:hypothetical protein
VTLAHDKATLIAADSHTDLLLQLLGGTQITATRMSLLHQLHCCTNFTSLLTVAEMNI